MTMAKYDLYTRMMLGGAALVLLAVALLHASGYSNMTNLISQPAIPNPWREGIRGVWVAYSLHLLLIAAMLIHAALRPRALSGPVLMLCAAFPVVDALLFTTFVGGFFFNALLGLASVLVFGAVARGTEPVQESPRAASR
jgi:uncharacterized membrane protein YhaH (DUF805 family)